jgi:hypothetical protein
MLVGFHSEGWDHLILRAFLAKLLSIPEEDIEPDVVDSSGRGWGFVLELLPKALHRFYGKCARLAVVGVDNDGNRNLLEEGLSEDPRRPRHWLHAPGQPAAAACRWCQFKACVDAVVPRLNWIPNKPGSDWPVVVVVPVEAIEAWLLVSQALVHHGTGSLHAENELRSLYKLRFYGKPVPTQTDVESKAVPLVRALDLAGLAALERHARSFAQFADHVRADRDKITKGVNCW